MILKDFCFRLKVLPTAYLYRGTGRSIAMVDSTHFVGWDKTWRVIALGTGVTPHTCSFLFSEICLLEVYRCYVRTEKWWEKTIS